LRPAWAKNNLCVVVHIYGPSYSGVVVGGLQFEASLGKVSMRPYLKNKNKKQKDWEHNSSDRALSSISSTKKKKSLNDCKLLL
jgi:hypothetical protein